MKAKKPAESSPRTIGGYQVHQTIELGGRVTANKDGSSAMWATMINQGTGMRILGHSLEMRSVDPRRTPFFDTLSSGSIGYGGDPYDASYLNISKWRVYSFAGSFRRDRNYFDYNLLGNNLFGASAFYPETSSPHLFNTVRRNTDALFTLLPLSRVSIRAGMNHGTHEGPSFSTVHEGGDALLLDWFRNAADTYRGGVDVKLARRTLLSYDQFYVLYKGDSWQQLTGADYMLANGQNVSFGINTTTTTKCNGALQVVNGVANPYCNAFTWFSTTSPTRTSFATEQLRFTSHYWAPVAMTGRAAYSGGISNVNSFNETYTGLTSRTGVRQEVDTGALGNGRLAHNRRISVNADYTIEAGLSRYVSVSDAIHFWYFRIPGMNSVNSTIWTIPRDTTQPNNGYTLLTSVDSLTPVTSIATNYNSLNQKNIGNTVLGIFTVTPRVKLSAGWRFNSRNIVEGDEDNLTWHQNWLLLGVVVQPSPIFRLNINYDGMRSRWERGSTPENLAPSDTYTRVMPNHANHLRMRARVVPAKWVNFAFTGNTYVARNDDPLVNHNEHNQGLSFAAQLIPRESVSLDLSFGHNDIFSTTDICYVYTGTAGLPAGATNAGTCTPANSPEGNTSYYLGNAFYNAPQTFFNGSVNLAPSRRFRLNGGAQVSTVGGSAERLNPNMVPGALQSTIVSPYADLLVPIAPQWTWHGNWMHHGYSEAGPAGPAPRSFHGDVITLSVKHEF
ncbi:MAG TPA: hypothetical protein VFI20_03810 [Terracidiphilus sp.]|nr:hypothetical protein [Terracidiphilus sp.]